MHLPINKKLWTVLQNSFASSARQVLQLILIGSLKQIALIILFILNLFPANSAWADSKIKILSVSADAKGIVLKHSSKEKVKVKYFTLDGSQPGQKRMVFDFQDSELTNNAVGGLSNLPKVQVKASQFSVKPMVSRIVVSGATEEVAKFSLSASSTNAKTLIIYQNTEEKKIPEKLDKKENPSPKTPSSPVTEKKEEEKETTKQANLEAGKLGIEGDSPTEIQISAPAQKTIKYKTFRLHSPERLVLDLYNWEGEAASLIPNKVNSSLVLGVRAGVPTNPSKDVIRLVLDLSQKGLIVDDKVSKDKKLLTLLVSVPVNDGLKDSLKELRKIRSDLKIVIDAGHGGYDAGAIHSGVEEKEITLSVSKLLGSLLESSQIKVVQTRKDDRFVSLEERVNITRNAKPDLFVSIHCNAMQSTASIKGLESYYFTPQSHNLVNTLHKKMVQRTKAPDRYVRKARFVVIRETAIPSVLMEIGFLSNPSERDKLTSLQYQKIVARALAEGIVDYLSSQKASSNTAHTKKLQGK